jgi:hypothetical protein
VESLPRNLPTILNYVQPWHFVVCDGCGTAIDVVWQPNEHDPAPLPISEHFFLHRCPECICAVAPADVRDILRKRYRRLRIDRCSVGLGGGAWGVDPPLPVFPNVREALRWPEDHPITVHAFTWRRSSKAADRVYVHVFVILGEIAASLQGHVNENNLISYPWFEIAPVEFADRPGGPVEIAAVRIGSNVRDPQRPRLMLQQRVCWSHPAKFEPLRIPGAEYYTPRQTGTFVASTMELFEHANRRGASQGTRIPKQELLDRYHAIKAEIGKRPTAATYREMFYEAGGSPLDPATLRKAIHSHGWKDYPQFADDADA